MCLRYEESSWPIGHIEFGKAKYIETVGYIESAQADISTKPVPPARDMYLRYSIYASHSICADGARYVLTHEKGRLIPILPPPPIPVQEGACGGKNDTRYLRNEQKFHTISTCIILHGCAKNDTIIL